MNREELEEKTKAELVEYAEVQGVKVLALDSKGTMIDKILGDHKAPDVPKKHEERLSPLGKLCTIDGKPINGKKYKVKIFDTQGDHNDVDLIVNGHNVRIQRGKEVILDEAYVEVLRNAVINTVQQDEDSGVRMAREQLCYPFSAVPA